MPKYATQIIGKLVRNWWRWQHTSQQRKMKTNVCRSRQTTDKCMTSFGRNWRYSGDKNDLLSKVCSYFTLFLCCMLFVLQMLVHIPTTHFAESEPDSDDNSDSQSKRPPTKKQKNGLTYNFVMLDVVQTPLYAWSWQCILHQSPM